MLYTINNEIIYKINHNKKYQRQAKCQPSAYYNNNNIIIVTRIIIMNPSVNVVACRQRRKVPHGTPFGNVKF